MTGKKILIVEDEKPMARALELKLTNLGYVPTVALNGEEGIAAIQKDTFDLILLDLMMPKKDGFSVMEDIKKMNIAMPPIIVTTNLSQGTDIEKAKALGATDYIVKSNTPLVEVVKRIENLLKK